MKKILSTLLILSIILSIFLFVGCEEVCEHVYVEKASEEYLLSNANCTSSAVYYKSCKLCGEKAEYTFKYGDEYHKYLDGDHCLLCNSEKPLFTMKVDEETYTTTVKFGSFPQSRVKGEELLDALNSLVGELPTKTDKKDWTAYEVYAEWQYINNISWYKDIIYDNEKYRAVYFVEYKPEITQNPLGTGNSPQYRQGYLKDTVYMFKWEPIVWKVLVEDTRETLIMSEYSIYGMEYYSTKLTRQIEGKTIYSNNYEHSNVRKWLNEDFYDQAFNQREKSAILLTEIDNSAPTTNIYGDPFHFENGVNNYVCNNTEDKIFMPSLVDMTNPEYGFVTNTGDNAGRYFKATDYAIATGCSAYNPTNEIDIKKDRNTYAWTRSPQSYYDFGMRRVDRLGGMSMSTRIDNASVAPIICLYFDTRD